MHKQKELFINTQSPYQIRVNQENHEIDQMFSQLKKDFDNTNSPPINQSKNFLTPTHRTERRTSTYSNANEEKRMKLMDYIYIRNTVRKNQDHKKIDNPMSSSQLRKSRMEQGKQKAFKTIVDQMIKELKQLSVKASAISQLVEDNIVYTGSIDQIAKMCSARRILHQNIFGSLGQLQKLIGIDNVELQAKQSTINQQKQERPSDSQIKRFEELGVKMLGSQTDFEDYNPVKKTFTKRTRPE